MGRCCIARLDRSRQTHPGKALDYRDSGRTLLGAARLLAASATEDESYGNAIGLLSVHAAISHADAVAIAFGGRKSVAGSHAQAQTLLAAVLKDKFPPAEQKRLRQILSQKDAMAYQGGYVPLEYALDLMKAAQRFATWAERMVERRP